MRTEPETGAADAGPRVGPGAPATTWLHIALIAVVVVVFEAQFVYVPVNPVDEGWPLYAAKRLAEGGVLYDDVFFVFPPGHLLPALVARGLDPAGVFAARVIYSGFTLALCLALYALGRRLMSRPGALLAALLVATMAPRTHDLQNLFGYRYLVWSVLALIAFDRRLVTGARGWLVAAGALVGVATAFRLTPGFAAGVGVGVGLLALRTGPAVLLRDAGAFAGGIFIALVPVIGWALGGVDMVALWREVVVRPVAMTDQQSLPIPGLLWPWETDDPLDGWIPLQFRLWPLLFVGFAIPLGADAVRAVRERRPLSSPLLVAVWAYALVYFARSLGRSDRAHLVSALPPVCLLLAYAVDRLGVRGGPRASAALAAASLALWLGLWRSHEAFVPRWNDWRGHTGEEVHSYRARREAFDAIAAGTRARLASDVPERVVLDLSGRPYLFTTGEFTGPGHFDVVMPGTFLDEEEERRFVGLLRADPPDGVYWSDRAFDEREERSVHVTAPLLSRWARERFGEPP